MHIKWSLLPFVSGNRELPKRHQAAGNSQEDSQSEQKDDGDEYELTHRETAAEFAKKDEEDIVRDCNTPITLWVLSTLFPLIAGTFGPMGSMFNIMAIAINWRVIVEPSSQEAEGGHIDDPRWLVAVNALSLAVAIVANLALLLQMGNRVRFNIASPISIAGWFISGIIDLALVSIAPSQLPLPTDVVATFSQAYYYCIFAGSIYVLLSIMLAMTAWGVWIGNYGSEFKLTMSQRSLMLQTILFLTYVLSAGAVYSRVEGWVYLDSCYYVVVTLFTIGFGDFAPQTHLGRSLFFPMSVGGIIFVGLIIANIRSLVIESASVKVSTRLVEMARYKALKSGNIQEGIVKVRGIMRRDTNAETEIERREKEFNVMREIQQVAAHNNRMLALGMSFMAFCILWFIGAVIFWQAEMAPGGQNWSYFEALYFTYTAQLTIGYGDYAPNTNSGKPAFVFWALIALPTLTVLIGAIGDAATDFVNYFFVWLGRHSGDLKRLGRIAVTRKHEAKELVDLAKRETSEHDGHAFRDIARVEQGGRIMPAEIDEETLDEGFDKDVADDAYRPYVVLQTAQRVLSHLEEDKPRKYSYAEWAWVLRLLGEDETKKASHRKLGAPRNSEGAVSPYTEHKHRTWSWLGQESPLMSLEDDCEPKWILKRLLRVLEQDVKRRADEHMAKKALEQVVDQR